MKSFWGKHEKDAASERGDRRGTVATRERVERRFTVGLARAEQLAIMLAKSRAAKTLEVADMLAGMYIYEWDRLSRFWRGNEEIEEFLRRMCSISPQRWNHWIEFYDRQRQEGVAHGFLRRAGNAMRRAGRGGWLRRGNGGWFSASGWSKHDSLSWNSPIEALEDLSKIGRSSELEDILVEAGEISPFRDEADGREVPVLTSECVLLCVAKTTESAVSRKLRDTGLDLAGLERAARDPRRTPHH